VLLGPCGLRASEEVRLKVKHIDSGQKISPKAAKTAMSCSPETLGLLRQWWKARRFPAT
jgi:integrase